MRHFSVIVLFLMWGPLINPVHAWPEPAYSDIFANARRILPVPLREFIEDMEPSFEGACSPIGLEAAVSQAIGEFRNPGGSPDRAALAMKDAGCAVAALNDPGMDSLVAAQSHNFVVVFYGWHPMIQTRNFPEYLRMREAERRRLEGRFGRTSELPNLSDNVELSPEFGMASIAFSRAVTDVANIWVYVWSSVNGALR